MTESLRISYRFIPFPYEFVTEDFLDDPVMMRFVVCMMRRISTSPKSIPLKNSHKQLSLDAFEFMYGRKKFSKEAGISEKNARTRLSQLIGLGYIEEVLSKRASTYTVYKIVTTAFYQTHGQHSGQDTVRQNSLINDHKQETKISREKNLRGTFNDTNVDDALFSGKHDEDIFILLNYCLENSIKIERLSIERWLKKYGSKYVTDHFLLLLASKKQIRKHEAWMEIALNKNYIRQNENIVINRSFTENFKINNGWGDLTITKVYCRHEPTQKDYKFNLEPEHFQRMIQECYEQHHGK